MFKAEMEQWGYIFGSYNINIKIYNIVTMQTYFIPILNSEVLKLLLILTLQNNQCRSVK